jgi:hypothetical protein
MANTLLTSNVIIKEGLRVLHNNLVFAKNVNRQYSKEFGVTGAKVGTAVNVRMPNRYYVSDGPSLQVQNSTDTTVAVSLTNQKHVDVNFSTADLTLSLDDFGKRILTPAMAVLASKIDQLGLAETINVYNQVGYPGSAPGTASGGSGFTQCASPIVFLNAGALLDMMSCPRDENRMVVMSPMAHAQSVDGLKALFQDSGSISDQYKKGLIGHALGFEFAMDQNIYPLHVGTRRGTPANSVVATTVSADAASFLAKISSDGAGTVNVGEIIEIASVYSVNPENQTSTGKLAQFVVTEAVAVSQSSFTIKVSPSIIKAGTGVANGTVDSYPQANAVITYKSGLTMTTGDLSGYYPIDLAYHQDAFTLATCDLEMPNGVDFAARENYDGISMRILRQYDIGNDAIPCRIDVLFGWKTLRPELAVRITE